MHQLEVYPRWIGPLREVVGPYQPAWQLWKPHLVLQRRFGVLLKPQSVPDKSNSRQGSPENSQSPSPYRQDAQ